MRRWGFIAILLPAALLMAAIIALPGGEAGGQSAVQKEAAAEKAQAPDAMPDDLPGFTVLLHDVRPLLRRTSDCGPVSLYGERFWKDMSWDYTVRNCTGLFNDFSDMPDTPEEALLKAIRLMTRTAEPWEAVGGLTTLELVPGGRLRVRATAADQQRVAETIATLMATRPKTVEIEVRAVELKGELATRVLDGDRPVFSTPRDHPLLREGLGQTHAVYLLTGTEGQVLAAASGQLQTLITQIEAVVSEGFSSR